MSLYLIADVETAERLEIDLAAAVRGFLFAGGRMVSLRGGSGDDAAVMKVGREIAGLVSAVRGTFLVHRRVDLAILLNADGVHLPGRGLASHQVRKLMGPSAVVGRSCHSAAEVLEHRKESDFLSLGPLFPSISKRGYGPAMSMERFSEIARAVSETPIYALGGVRPQNCEECLRAGASGVAVVGGVLGTSSAFEATVEYLEALSGVADDGGRGRGIE